jgi:hypothetical protein
MPLNVNIVKSNKSRMVVNTKIRGVDLDTTRLIYHETPTPPPNGVQTVFTVVNAYVSGTLQVFLDGLQQIKVTDYSETTSTTFTMVDAPASDEVLMVSYVKQ